MSEIYLDLEPILNDNYPSACPNHCTIVLRSPSDTCPQKSLSGVTIRRDWFCIALTTNLTWRARVGSVRPQDRASGAGACLSAASPSAKAKSTNIIKGPLAH